MKKGAASTAGSIAAAVLAAFFVSLAGTALHRQTVSMAGVDLPWGLVAALLLLASVQLWLAAWRRSVVPTAVAGIVTYAAVGVLSSGGSAKQLVVADLAGNVWAYGIAGVTFLMLLVASRLRARWNAAVEVAPAAGER
jgi:N-acetyl-1-D-myo-inositol-2-amino-2-deoxy-alpha-D-glucopyranoside deacetylase